MGASRLLPKIERASHEGTATPFDTYPGNARFEIKQRLRYVIQPPGEVTGNDFSDATRPRQSDMSA